MDDLHFEEGYLDSFESLSSDKNENSDLPPGYEIREDASGRSSLYYRQSLRDAKTGNVIKVIDHWLCGYFVTLHRMRDDDGRNWVRVFAMIDDDGKRKEIIITPLLKNSEGKVLKTFLEDEGLSVTSFHEQFSFLRMYLHLSNPKSRLLSVRRTGWIRKGVYVFPDEVLGTSEKIRFSAHGEVPPYNQRGTLEEWRHHIGRFLAGNHRLMAVVFQSLCSPLLTPMNRENFGIHFVCHSSVGKSTTLRVACSVFGSDFKSWNTTSNAAESWGNSSNDNLLVLDDMGKATPETVSLMVYMLADGQGKGRSAPSGVARSVVRFKSCFLSSGEMTVEHKLREGKISYQAGQSVRLLEIPADAGVGLGLFNTLHDFKDGACFADYLVQASSRYCGPLGREWIQTIIHHEDDIVSRIHFFEGQFMDFVSLPQGADSQIRRVAGHFAFMAAVGEVAIERGILPFLPYDGFRSCSALFKDWLDHRGGVDSLEMIQACEGLRSMIVEHGVRFFNPWAKKVINYQEGECKEDKRWDSLIVSNIQRPVRMAGYRKPLDNNEFLDDLDSYVSSGGDAKAKIRVMEKYNTPDSWHLYLIPSVMEKDILKGKAQNKNQQGMLKMLIQRGWIIPDKDGSPTKVIKVPGEGSMRVYHIKMVTSS
jgi:putative DNA primase/helicase